MKQKSTQSTLRGKIHNMSWLVWREEVLESRILKWKDNATMVMIESEGQPSNEEKSFLLKHQAWLFSIYHTNLTGFHLCFFLAPHLQG